MTSRPEKTEIRDLSLLPSVDRLLRSSAAGSIRDAAGADRLTALARAVLDEMRSALADGELRAGSNAREALLDEAEARLNEKWRQMSRRGLGRVINATGVVIHTNLGRAPLSNAARNAIVEAAGYCALEYDLSTGARGRRGQRVDEMLCELTGAEDAVVVNNCAAAALLVLSAFAAGREVIVSRGELVEIGGDFRVPDVLARSGATLREVGTTNRTKLADYERAIGENTAVLLRVHPSNFRIVGFTAAPAIADLAELAHERGILLIEDAGSGATAELRELGITDEPVIAESIAAGADIVTFSGDKLLGGPQAGLIVGRRELVERVRRHPLYRALRVDKLIYAALEATLDAHLSGRAAGEVPVLKMLAAGSGEIRRRAEALVDAIAGPSLTAELIDGLSAVGGGSAPLEQPFTTLIALRHSERTAAEMEASLRAGRPPVVARIADDRLLIDLRTVAAEDEGLLRDALSAL
ncbi:MAG: L-seryl-tRNA(Sec) selenium transferase [Pyrinomonadaceae bacterium]